MRTLIIRRLLWVIPILIGVSIVAFVLMRAVPGDYVQMMLGTTADLSEEQMAVIRAQYGLDKSIAGQYVDWVIGAVQGDLGTSFVTKRPVTQELMTRLGVTFQLAAMATLFSVVLGVITGTLSARRKGIVDWVVRMLNGFTLAIPNFVVATLIVLLFGLYLPRIAIFTYVPFLADPIGSIKSMLLAAFSLGIGMSVTISENTRAALLEVASQDYVMVARAKGLRRSTILGQYLFKNAVTPIITVTGLQFAGLLGGQIVVETIFAIPGLGQYLFLSVTSRDYPVIQGIVLLTAVIVIIVNLLVDLAYARVDARVSYD